MASRWTHNSCEKCWKKNNPDRQPIKAAEGYKERCCYCGDINTDGIWMRDDPLDLPCEGIAGVHEKQ